MKLLLVDRKEISLNHELIWTLVTVGVLLVGAITVYAPWVPVPVGQCPFKLVTGLPCASCGATRALQALLLGDVPGALAVNPLFALVYIGGAAWAVYGLTVTALGLRRVRISMTKRGLSLTLAVALPAAVIANWAYLIWAGV